MAQQDGITKVIAGYRHFTEEIYPEHRELFDEPKDRQNPQVLFITCADSRIDPSLITHTVPGELFIGGDGVARGYYKRPDLTTERFLPDPFRDSPGARIYRTGDLVRRRPSGDLEFLGRLDGQIKLFQRKLKLGGLVEEKSQKKSSVGMARFTTPASSMKWVSTLNFLARQER